MEEQKSEKWSWKKWILLLSGGFMLFLVVGLGFMWSYRTELVLWWVNPGKPFSAFQPPPVPIYTKDNAWAALPTKKSFAKSTPKGTQAPKNAPADVFFLHPTTYLGNKGWNAPFNERGASKAVDQMILKHQASAFHSCCRIFVPRYRQVNLYYNFAEDTKSAEQALELAYQDVLKAFRHYLKHWNKGRPFFLASHSQGSQHALRLLEDVIVREPINKQLIAAYIVGVGLPMDKFKKGLRTLHPCRHASDVRCVVHWNTLGEEWRNRTSSSTYARLRLYYPEGYRSNRDKKRLCTNPITWKIGGKASAEENRGAVRYSGGKKPLGPALVGAVGAECHQGSLLIGKPKVSGFRSLGDGDFHILDYNLFYMNIRRNAVQRMKAFLQNGSQAKATSRPTSRPLKR